MFLTRDSFLNSRHNPTNLQAVTYAISLAEGDMMLVRVPNGEGWRLVQLETLSGDGDLYYSYAGRDNP